MRGRGGMGAENSLTQKASYETREGAAERRSTAGHMEGDDGYTRGSQSGVRGHGGVDEELPGDPPLQIL